LVQLNADPLDGAMRTVTTIVILVVASSGALADSDPQCSTSGSLPQGAVFVGYTTPGAPLLNSLALLVAKKLQPYDGRSLSVGLTLHEAVSTSPTVSSITSIKPYMDLHGINHCEYPAELSASPSKSWRLWLSDPELALRSPTRAERDSLRKMKPDCVSQGDYPPGKEQCVHAELLAVSDFNGNGLPEYWHTAPYMWETGLEVSELLAEGGLVPLVSACPGCD
jgi:hypothetical protein